MAGAARMNKIDLTLPPEAVTIGELYDTMDRDFLTEDIVQVSLPNGIHVDVGWYPDLDPSGSFHVVVFRDTWENRLMESTTRDPQEVKRLVEEYVAQYGGLKEQDESGTLRRTE